MPIIFNKPVQSSIISKTETNTTKTVNSSNLLFTLSNRTQLSNRDVNYFASFNLPAVSTNFSQQSVLSISRPELQQLNVDNIVVCPIPASFYNEIIDGRSITFTVPQVSGATVSAKTVVSSTYTTLQKQDASALLGENIAYLFCDEINKPYTGTTNSRGFSKSANTTWNTASYIYRPAATSFTQIDLTPPDTDVNSDTRSTVRYANTVSSGYPTGYATGYNYDIPVGFVCLDKGFMVLTHPLITSAIPWTLGYKSVLATPNTGSTSATTNIYFADTSVSSVSFVETSTRFKQSVICLAMPGEFYWTENPTFDKAFAYGEQLAGTNGYKSLYTTELGLYNTIGELIGVAKFDRPVEKNYTNIITINVDIDV